MKAIKRVTLFLIYPSLMLILGFWGGVKATRFFYPGEVEPQIAGEEPAGRDERRNTGQEISNPETAEAAQREETLSVDTKYVLEEADVLRGTVVETVWKLPGKYVGMDREQFLQAMEIYESSPPLSEMERGFVSLEVLAFSRARVVVQMNYRYLQPGENYYLAVLDNEVVVYLDDMKTVYINTGIRLDTLPQTLQAEIIQMLLVEDEEKLYNFLETYSS